MSIADTLVERVQKGEPVTLVVGLVMGEAGLQVSLAEVKSEELAGEFTEPEEFTVPPMILAMASGMM